MKWIILPLIALSSLAHGQQNPLSVYQCYKGLVTSDATLSSPCYNQAQAEVSEHLVTHGEPKWVYATCFAVVESVTPSPASIEKAKASFKKNVGTFQSNEIKFNNFYFSAQPEIESNVKTDYGQEFKTKLLNSKHVVKVQTASVKAADGAIICKTHLQIVNK